MRTVSPGAVRGVAVDATSGTIVLVDGDGSALTAGLMYDDTRATAYVDRVNAAGGAVWAELGYGRMQPSWALPKLLWLLDEHPELRRGARLAHQADFINRRLVGREVPADLSNALKTGAHLVDERWPEEVMEALGVPADLLPIFGSRSVASEVLAGKREPSKAHIRKLAEFFRVSADLFL